MQKMDPKKNLIFIDLNLLRFLNALIQTQSITRSGDHLGLSQPAASRTMSKLRKTLNDPLLVRTRSGYVLTPLAQSLMPLVARALTAAGEVFAAKNFDPASSNRIYRIATTDYGAQVVFPKIASVLAQEAPHVHLLSSLWGSDTLADLENGKIDLAFYADDQIPGDFHSINLFRETYVLITKKAHPLQKIKTATLSKLLSEVSQYKHIIARYPNNRVDSGDDVLERLGAKMSQPRISLPYFGISPMIVAESDLIMGVPQRLAERYIKHFPIEIIPIPTQVEDFSYRLIWHGRSHRDLGLQWLQKK